jgi:hypothetical protein
MIPNKTYLVTHMGHDGPWLLIKTAKEIHERRKQIRTSKPKYEWALRFRLLRVVKAPLPPSLAAANATWFKANATWSEANATWARANTTWFKANTTWFKANATWATRANTTWFKANAMWATWVSADATWARADTAWARADAAWFKAINSRTGVKFHNQVCGCAWTPEQPNILKQLTPL